MPKQQNTINDQQRNILIELQYRLSDIGECDTSDDTCPTSIGRKMFPIVRPEIWSCKDCIKYFLWLRGQKIMDAGIYKPIRNDYKSFACPCFVIPYDTLMLRLEELINTLT